MIFAGVFVFRGYEYTLSRRDFVAKFKTFETATFAAKNGGFERNAREAPDSPRGLFIRSSASSAIAKYTSTFVIIARSPQPELQQKTSTRLHCYSGLKLVHEAFEMVEPSRDVANLGRKLFIIVGCFVPNFVIFVKIIKCSSIFEKDDFQLFSK